MNRTGMYFVTFFGFRVKLLSREVCSRVRKVEGSLVALTAYQIHEFSFISFIRKQKYFRSRVYLALSRAELKECF